MSKTKSITVRLSDEDEQVLQDLAAQFDTDRSTAVRQAIRIALRPKSALTDGGLFIPANTPEARFNVRLMTGETYG